MYVTYEADIDPQDVLDELTDDELVDELKRRRKESLAEVALDTKGCIEQLYMQYRGKDAPEPLRTLVWSVLGRVL